MAKQLPDTTALLGIDISTTLFPEIAPKNVTFLAHNILALPSDWTSKFALVHQRFLVVALRREEWAAALSELFRVTQPGGWIQVEECFGFFPEKGDDEAPYQNKWIRVMDAFAARTGLFIECAAFVAGMLRDAGFEHVVEKRLGCAIGVRGNDLGSRVLDFVLEPVRAMKVRLHSHHSS